MAYPVRILQFGDGVFLRAFFDWMVEAMNAQGLFQGSVAIVKPRPGAFSPAYARQGLAWRVSLKGILDGRRVERVDLVSSASRLVNPYEDFVAYLAEARNPELRVIVSNTTESGIVAAPEDRAMDRPALSFPGKLTQLLKARYDAFQGAADSGLLIIPCELIEDNAAKLKALVLGHAASWYADPGFAAWLEKSCTWIDSLVDRIVTGFTAEERAAILKAEGVEDELVAVAEPYHLLALRGTESLDKILPLKAAGLNVVWALDISPWRELKVRLLNGSHTLIALAGLALGKKTVLECVGDPLLMEAVRTYQLLETIPTIGGKASPIGRPEAEAYLSGVLERFSNPDLAHKLEGIASKSVAKYAARIMPTVKAQFAIQGRATVMASFILAALVDRYTSGAVLQDEAAPVAWFEAHRAEFATPGGVAGPKAGAAMAEALGPAGPWGDGKTGLPGQGNLAAEAVAWLGKIRGLGMGPALTEAIAEAKRRQSGK